MRRLIVVVFLSCVVQSSQGMTIRGAPTCGGWLTQRSSPTGESVELAWIVGYLSGLAIGFNEDVLGSVDNPAIAGWLDTYCRDHPLESFGSAGQDLFIELANKAKR